MNKIKSISLMFPLYKDRNTVKLMITKSSNVLRKLKIKYEIIIVDDGCPQNSGKLAKEIAKKFTNVKIFFHKKNLKKLTNTMKKTSLPRTDTDKVVSSNTSKYTKSAKAK